jgi:2-amino-4-hydroxy-6-hydroxymethyldihydropteridine diphosphokinase
MNNACLLLGSNLGDKKQNLEQAFELLEKNVGKVIKKSSLYSTQAWGNTKQEDFLNQAVWIQTALNPSGLMQTILNIEEKMGRIRNSKWEPRKIDIDILLYNQTIIQTNDLWVPHPHLPQRRFALVPLTEIAPDLIHPIFKKTISTLLAECSDTLLVQKIQ